MSLCLFPTLTMWLPCGAPELAWDDSAGPWEKKGMLGAGSGERGVEKAMF